MDDAEEVQSKLSSCVKKIQTNTLKCRLCLSSTTDLIDIFSEKGQQMDLPHKLMSFCNLLVDQDDNLTKSICFTCLNEINRFSDFYSRIQENQKLLEAIPVNVWEESDDSTKAENDIVASVSDDDLVEVITANESGDVSENEINDIQVRENQDISEQNLVTNNISTKSSTLKITKGNAEHIKSTSKTATQNVLKGMLSCSTNKAYLKKLIDEYKSKSKTLILPTQKSNYRISLDEKLRDFFDLSCPRCNLVFLTFATMKKHMEEDHSEQGFVMCCNKQFYRREAIMEHINYHLNPKQFVCDICNQTCKSKITLKIHLKQHIPTEERPFGCNRCGQRFVLNSQLKSHEKSHLTNEEKKYVCEECGKAFAFKFVLEKHKQHMHIKQKNYMCEICARSFVDKVNLTAHKRTHDDTTPRLQCPLCDALLKNKTTLKIHMRNHNPASHPCPKCGKILLTKNALVNHIQYTHGDKKYPCSICKKEFKKALTLKEHMTLHTGEILYKCEYCDRTFKAKANQYAHVKKKHTAEWAEKKKLKWGVLN